MFATIRKHQQWLFILICGVIIVSFVIFFSPDIGLGERGRPRTTALINGQPVPQGEFDATYEEAAIEFYFRYRGYWPWSNEVPDSLSTNFSRTVLQKVVLLRKIKEMNVDVSEEAVVEQIRLNWTGENGAYDPERYKFFITNTLANVRFYKLTESDYFRLVRHQLAQQQLFDTFGVAGQLVTKAAAEAEFRRENERLATQAVFFNITNYLADVTIETNAVRRHYTNDLARYMKPAEVQIRYVQFDATNYLAEAEKRFKEKVGDLTAEIERAYQERGSNAFLDADGKALSKEKAQEKVREELLEEHGLHTARMKANEFAHALHAELERLGAGGLLVESNFIQVAEAQKLKTQVTEPFSTLDGPERFDARTAIATAARDLTGTNLVRIDPIVGQKSVFLIALNKYTGSKPKEFKEVEKEVTENYREQQARIQMQKVTRELYQKITNSVAGGKAFKAAAEELKLTVVDVEPFSKSEASNFEVARRDIGFPNFRDTAFRTKVGETSYPRFPQGSGAGFILHVKEAVAADETTLKEELDEYVNSFRQRRQSAAFQAWYSREVESAGIAFAN